MFKRLLARLFGRKQPVAVKAPMATRNHAMARRNVIVSTPSARDDRLVDRFIEGRHTPIWVDATAIGDTCKREVLASYEPVNGWISWHGGMFRPVRSDTIIDVMFANGNVKHNLCAGSVLFEWQKTPKDSQRVTAYRLRTDKG